MHPSLTSVASDRDCGRAFWDEMAEEEAEEVHFFAAPLKR
jgi:hypothetical protein